MEVKTTNPKEQLLSPFFVFASTIAVDYHLNLQPLPLLIVVWMYCCCCCHLAWPPVIMKLAPPTAKGLPAPPPILIANNNRDTSSSLHQGVTQSQPTKAASLSLSPVEKFLLENLLFAAMAAAVAVAAVMGVVIMQGQVFDKGPRLWDVWILLCREYSPCYEW